MAEGGEDCRPYRTVVAWYCWRAVFLYFPVATVAPISAAPVVGGCGCAGLTDPFDGMLGSWTARKIRGG